MEKFCNAKSDAVPMVPQKHHWVLQQRPLSMLAALKRAHNDTLRLAGGVVLKPTV